MTRSRTAKIRKKYTRKLKYKKIPFDPYNLIDNKTFELNLKAILYYMTGFCATKKKPKGE